MKDKFFLWNQSINIIYPNEKNVFIVPNHEKKMDYYVNPYFVQLIEEFWFSKWLEVTFFLQNQSINSFIPKKRMNLLCPIIKRKRIIKWIRIYPNWKMSFNSKNGRKMSFSYETKASISFILIRIMCLRCPITKKKRDCYVNPSLS